MTISGMEGVTLDSVKFEVEKDMYDINLSENMPGTLSEDRYKRFWSKNEGQVVNAISFYNSGIASEIKKITVYYKVANINHIAKQHKLCQQSFK